MSEKRKNKARKALSTVLASIGLVYLGVTVIVRGTHEADEVSGIIAGFALVLSTLGILGAHGRPRRARPAGPVGPEITTGPPLSLTTTGAHALAAALGMPPATCERGPGALPCPSAGSACGQADTLVVIVLNRR